MVKAVWTWEFTIKPVELFSNVYATVLIRYLDLPELMLPIQESVTEKKINIKTMAIVDTSMYTS